METNNRIVALLKREVKNLYVHPIYIICMVVLPLLVTFFFTSFLGEGQPENMPIGIVDNDNTTVTRKLTRMIDGFQSSEVVAHYPSLDHARKAMQRNEIYGFIYFPEKMTEHLMAQRQPRMSVYYSNTSIMAGTLLYKEMRTLCTLGSAAVGQSVLLAKGATERQAQEYLQPIVLDAHNIGNPWTSYNIYLSNMLVPTCLLIFVFLLAVFTLGTELKFGTHKELLEMADGDVLVALLAKLLPQTVVFTMVMLLSVGYMYNVLDFPAPGGMARLVVLCVLTIVAAQGFAVFMFGVIPSLRMAMSICSLWGVMSFSLVGTTFPLMAMDAPLQSLAWLFPIRHYYVIYQLCVFNDYSLVNVWPNLLTLFMFVLLPLLVLTRIKKAFTEFEYQP